MAALTGRQAVTGGSAQSLSLSLSLREHDEATTAGDCRLSTCKLVVQSRVMHSAGETPDRRPIFFGSPSPC